MIQQQRKVLYKEWLGHKWSEDYTKEGVLIQFINTHQENTWPEAIIEKPDGTIECISANGIKFLEPTINVDSAYWKQRCEAAEKLLDDAPSYLILSEDFDHWQSLKNQQAL